MTVRGFLLFLIVLLSLTSPAAAQTEADKTTARQLFFEARDAYTAKDFAKSAELFRRSNDIYPAPTARLGMARALREGGKLVEAFETFNGIVNDGVADGAPDAFADAVKTAGDERTALQPRLPALVIDVTCVCTPAVSIDGSVIPAAALGVKRYVDPGERVIAVNAEGHLPVTQTVTVAEGQVDKVAITLNKDASVVAPTPTPTPMPTPEPDTTTDDGSGMRIAGLVIGGVGVAALIVAGITGGLYLAEKGTVGDNCSDNPDGEGRICDQEGVDAADRGNTMALINTITLPAGAVALGVGLTLFFLAPSEGDSAIVPALGPQYAGLSYQGGF